MPCMNLSMNPSESTTSHDADASCAGVLTDFPAPNAFSRGTILVGIVFLSLIVAAVVIAASVKPGALILITYVVFLGIPFLYILFLIKSRGETAKRVQKHSYLTLEELLPVLFPNKWNATQPNVKRILRIITGHGWRNETARVGRKTKLSPVHPLTEIFEPVPVDESVSLFVALEHEDSQTGADDSLAPTQQDERQATRKLKRHVALAGGLGIFIAFGFNAVMAGIESWQRKRISFGLVMWTIWLIVSAVGLGGRGAWSWRQQWLLVPGGIVSRKSRMFQSKTVLHVFRRIDSVLIAQYASRKLWAVYVADSAAVQMARMTPREAHLLLRAWLSPIPPPALERLSDLE